MRTAPATIGRRLTMDEARRYDPENVDEWIAGYNAYVREHRAIIPPDEIVVYTFRGHGRAVAAKLYSGVPWRYA